MRAEIFIIFEFLATQCQGNHRNRGALPAWPSLLLFLPPVSSFLMEAHPSSVQNLSSSYLIWKQLPLGCPLDLRTRILEMLSIPWKVDPAEATPTLGGGSGHYGKEFQVPNNWNVDWVGGGTWVDMHSLLCGEGRAWRRGFLKHRVQGRNPEYMGLRQDWPVLSTEERLVHSKG